MQSGQFGQRTTAMVDRGCIQAGRATCAPMAISRRRVAVVFCAILGVTTSLIAAGSPLIDAIKSGDRAAVQRLVRDRALVNSAEADGTTALHWAVRAADEAAVRLLLRAGANADPTNRYGVTPLALAALNGDSASTRALLEAGAAPDIRLAE